MIFPQFNELIYRLEVPHEYLPGQNTPQSDRAIALLQWASALGGIGLAKVKEAVDSFSANP